MKKTYIVLIAIVLIAVHGYSVTPVSSFTKIDLSSVGKVYVTQGDSNSVVVNTDAEQKDIDTKVKGNTLVISSNAYAEYHVTMKNIEELTISGSGEIVTDSSISADMLHLNVSGSGKMTIGMKAKNLVIDLGGVGKMNLSGSAENATINISGSGKVEGFDLHVDNCKANISGVGKCNIDVTESLFSSVSGMGTVHYKTKPKSLKEDVSGIGKVSESNGNNEGSDTTRFKLGNSEMFIIKNDSTRSKKKEKNKQTKPLWQGIELGFNNYFNAYGKTEVTDAPYLELNTGKSVSFSLNLLEKDFQFGKSNFWFFTGLGVTWNNYRFDKNVFIASSKSGITGGYDTTATINFLKSKLTTSYLTAPLMFEFFTARKYKNAFHLGGGALLGYHIGSHTKQKYIQDGNTHKPKVYDDLDLNPFRYGLRVAAGYGKFNIFADYYYSTLFRDSKGPELYPVNLGITLVGF